MATNRTKLFFCWSGELSRKVAEIFYDYVELSPLNVDPKFSREGIASGEKWPEWIDSALDGTHLGWLFMTRENLKSHWMHFEAGSLARAGGKARVCPVLIDARDAELSPPLSQFHARPSDKDGVTKLLKDLNGELGEEKTKEETLMKSLDKEWDGIAEKIENARKVQGPADEPPLRAERELLEEILVSVRSRENSAQAQAEFSKAAESLNFLVPSLMRIERILDATQGESYADRHYGRRPPPPTEQRYEPGDLVMHIGHGVGKVAQVGPKGELALVFFDNPTTSSKEPLEVSVRDLKPLRP